MVLNEHIKLVAGCSEWYGYDFSIAINYLKFVLTLNEDTKHLISRIEELEEVNLPRQVIVQDIMSRL